MPQDLTDPGLTLETLCARLKFAHQDKRSTS
jgi:hypothetical protein